MAGAEVTWYWPRSRRSTPRVRSTWPLRAEVGARPAGVAVEGDQPGVERGREDAQRAGLAGPALASRQADTPREVTSE